MTALANAVRAHRAPGVQALLISVPVSFAAAAAVAVSPMAAAALVSAVVGVATLRRWPSAIWAGSLLVSLFLYHAVWTRSALSVGTLSLHVSDALPVAIACGALCGGIRRPALDRPARIALASAGAFFAIVVLDAYRSVGVSGLSSALQARHLTPYLLVVVLPFSASFSRVSARRIADLIAVGLIALGVRSLYLVGTGHQARLVPGVERIFQTWEPFIAAALGLALLGFVLAARGTSPLHYAGLVASVPPVLFSFFRTAWVLEAGLGVLLLAAVRGRRRRARLVFAVVACLLVVGVAGTRSGGSGARYAAEVSSRFHEITPQLDSYRTQEYHAVWREIRRDVVFGSGFGTEYTGDWTIYRSWSHNAYEWMWWRLGLVGLASFLALLAGATAAGLRAARRLEGDEKGLAIGLTAALLFTALAANLHENFENFQTNTLAAVILAQLIVLGSRRKAAEAR